MTTRTGHSGTGSQARASYDPTPNPTLLITNPGSPNPVSNQRIIRLVRLTCLTNKNPSVVGSTAQGFDYSIEYVAFPNNTYLTHVHIIPRGGQSSPNVVSELLQRLVEALSPRNFTITVYYNSSSRIFRNKTPSPGEL